MSSGSGPAAEQVARRSRTRVIRFCHVITPASSSTFSASATVLRAHPALSAIASYDGKHRPSRLLWKPHSRALQNLEEGAGDRTLVLTRPTVPGAPRARVGGYAALGVAVQRHGAAGTEHLLAAAALSSLHRRQMQPIGVRHAPRT